MKRSLFQGEGRREGRSLVGMSYDGIETLTSNQFTGRGVPFNFDVLRLHPCIYIQIPHTCKYTCNACVRLVKLVPFRKRCLLSYQVEVSLEGLSPEVGNIRTNSQSKKCVCSCPL